MVPPASATACLCDGINCGYEVSDYIFFIPWVVLLGLCTIASGVLCSYLLYQLSKFASGRTGFILKHSIFFLLSCISMLFLVAFTVVLFTFSNTNYFSLGYMLPSQFLAIEGLQIGLIILQLVSVLVVSAVRLKRTLAGGAGSDQHSSWESRSRSASTGKSGGKTSTPTSTQSSASNSANLPAEVGNNNEWEASEVRLN